METSPINWDQHREAESEKKSKLAVQQTETSQHQRPLALTVRFKLNHTHKKTFYN